MFLNVRGDLQIYLNSVVKALAAYWPFMTYTASFGCKPSGQIVYGLAPFR
jgi:hypothetical protein